MVLLVTKHCRLLGEKVHLTIAYLFIWLN